MQQCLRLHNPFFPLHDARQAGRRDSHASWAAWYETLHLGRGLSHQLQDHELQRDLGSTLCGRLLPLRGTPDNSIPAEIKRVVGC
jgi:hypothetical protein